MSAKHIGEKVWYRGCIWTVLDWDGERLKIGRGIQMNGRPEFVVNVKIEDIRLAFS